VFCIQDADVKGGISQGTKVKDLRDGGEGEEK
jgi:hypothetical protein